MKHKNHLLEKIHLHADYAQVFGTEQGQRVLEHICKTAHIGSPTRVKGDPEQSLENEGMRRLALSILRFAKKDHKDIVEQIEMEYRHEI